MGDSINFIQGAIPSPQDFRDYVSTAIIPKGVTLEPKFCWYDPYTLDQGSFGTCVACAGAGIKDNQEYQEGNVTELSPLFLYTLCKKHDGIPNTEGTYCRTAMQMLKNYGIIPESMLPYSLLQNIRILPEITQSMLNTAVPLQIGTYAQVPINLEAIKQAIKLSPTLGTVYVTDGFMYPKNGYVRYPQGKEYGYHAIKFIGYDDTMVQSYENKTYKGFLIFKNSWGKYWGENGVGYIPYELLSSTTANGYYFFVEMWSCVDKITPKPDDPTPKPKYWKVQVGAFKEKKNAQNFVAVLKTSGYDTYLPPANSDGLYRIQLGAFSSSSRATSYKNKLLGENSQLFKGLFIVYN